MKPTALLLAASIAANAAMVAALVFKPTLAPPAFQDFFGAARFRPTGVSPARATTAAHTTATAAPAAVWSKLRTDNLKAMIAQLRDAGFPIWAIRALVRAQVDADFNVRMRELMAPDPTLPFWKSSGTGSAMFISAGGGGYMSVTSERMTEYSRLARERSKLMKELLGDFAMRDDGDLTTPERRRYGNLDRSKIDAIARIDEDYGEMNNQVRAVMNGVTLPEDREKLALLERERRADIAALLTPQEMADFDMRNSTTTMRLRPRLSAFKPTEEEFRTIYGILQPFEDTLNPALALGNAISGTLPGGSFVVGSGSSPAEARAAAQKQVNDQLRAALGEQRYAEYVRSGDREYQQLSLLAERENLAPTAAIDAYNLRQKVSEEANRIVADRALPDDAKFAAMKALAQNTRGQIVATLGPAAGKSYLNMAEPWLAGLERGRAFTFMENGGMSYRNVGLPAGAVGGRGGGVIVPPSTPQPTR